MNILPKSHLSFGNNGNWDIANKLQNFRSTERWYANSSHIEIYCAYNANVPIYVKQLWVISATTRFSCTNLWKCDFSPLQLRAVCVTHVPIIPMGPSVTQLAPGPLAVAGDRGLSQFKVDRLQIIVVAKKYIYVSRLFISRMPKMRAIPPLVSAPLNPIPIAEHFRRGHPPCEHSRGQHM